MHDYNNYGFPGSKEPYASTPEQKARVRRGYEKKVEWMKANNLPIWNGEWGPVYARRQYEGERTDAINNERIALLKDQLEVYESERISWSIWLYKDIGFQGMVYTSLETPYMKRFEKFLAKKHRLAIDAWGADETEVRPVYSQLEAFIAENVAPEHRNLYPAPVWKFEMRIGRLSRNILLAEYMVQEWADLFRGLSFEELDALAASFKFENCHKREELNKAMVATLV